MILHDYHPCSASIWRFETTNCTTRLSDDVRPPEADGAADRADQVVSALADAAEDTAKAAMDGVKNVVLAANDRVSLGGVEVSPLGIGAWSWGDSVFWGYSEAMDKELQEVSMPYVVLERCFFTNGIEYIDDLVEI